MDAAEYEPFAAGRCPVGVRTIEAADQTRNRLFPCEIWYPADAADTSMGAGPDAGRDAAAPPGTYPLIVFSHFSGGHRRSCTFLCTHLASHGYVVAALDHSEVVARELAPGEGETEAERAARIDAVIASRVPDVRFLLDHLLGHENGSTPAGAAPASATCGRCRSPVRLRGSRLRCDPSRSCARACRLTCSCAD